jgi:predicted TIM-barrel fold metal-dependent hydrolase
MPQISKSYGYKIIDVHCHIGKGIDYELNIEDMLSEMKQNGVSQSVIAPVDSEIVIQNKEGNKRIAKIKKKHPDEILGWAVANPWYKHKAIDILKEAYELGLDGLKFHPQLQGVMINSKMVYPLIEFAERVNWPVYFHTGTPISSMPLQLANLAGRFPKVIFIMGHLAFSDFWYDVPAALKLSPNMLAETSHTVPGFIKNVITAGEMDRLIFGSDSPICSLRGEIAKIKGLKLKTKDEEAIFSRTIKKVLRK